MMVTMKNQWIVVGLLLLCLNLHDTIAFSLSTAPAKKNQSTSRCSKQRRKTELSASLEEKDSVDDSQQEDAPAIVQKKPRRVRYAGKYPRNFKDKYKEHEGDDATISKVLAKGMTPAGTHVPIMLKECFQHMGLLAGKKKEDEPLLVVDCTLGYGGHSSHILRALKQQQQNQVSSNNSELIAFDQDSLEIAKTEARLREEFLSADDDDSVQFTAVNQNFCTLKSHLESTGQVGKVTSLLADLGLSSMQIDDNDRGFTYKREGPLDMRMNNKEGETAYELLCRLKPKQLKRMLQENSDEIYATEVAFGLLHKKHTIPETTVELATRVREIVEPLMVEAIQPKKVEKKQLDSTVARVMQALRIELNGEFLVLEQLLQDLPSVLAPGGRAVFLTFHSGEDRRVKKALKAGFKSGIYSSWSRRVDRPTAAEKRNNPRSSCCKLRWAIRSEEVVE